MPRSHRPSKSSKSSKSSLDRAKALPWALLLQAGYVVGKRLNSLSPPERERLAKLVKESGGRLNTLSDKERKELRKITGKLDLRGMGGELLPLIRGGRRSGRRR
jgi:hypothetical protein